MCFLLRSLRRWKADDPALPLGPRAEARAAKHLKRAGFRILARNLRNAFGEVDLLIEDRAADMIAVVEVKAARVDDPPPEVHVSPHKQRKLTAVATQIIRRYNLENRAVRFDVVAVVWPAHHDQPTRLTHHPNAFQATV